jgi:16S rRNA (guanine966-N2)-methyltransferase
VLDLFGGSGAIGFELLSNGASSVTFVELDEAAARLIRSNAEELGVGQRVNAVGGDALRVLPDLATRKMSFDVVVVAPPYGKGLQAAALTALERSGVLNPAGVVVVQREDREPPTPGTEGLPLTRVRRYGRTVFEFFEPRPAAERPDEIA